MERCTTWKESMKTPHSYLTIHCLHHFFCFPIWRWAAHQEPPKLEFFFLPASIASGDLCLSRRKCCHQRSSVAGCLHSTGFSLSVPLSLYLPFCLPLSHRGHNDIILMSLIKKQENNEWGCRTATETQPLCLSLTEVGWAQSGVEQYGSCK